MSIWSDIVAGGEKIETFLTNLQLGANRLQALYSSLSIKTLPAVAAVFYDVVKCVAAATSAGAAGETGNIPLTISLSETTLTLVKQTITDAKAGEADVVADFEALGIKLP